jgi:hypothetical protein
MEATTYAEDVGIYLTIEGITTSTTSPPTHGESFNDFAYKSPLQVPVGFVL